MTSDSGAEPPRTRCTVDRTRGGAYQWRLTAQNGRVVAVSAVAHPDLDSCRRAFAGTRSEATALVGTVLHSTEPGGGWVWGARGGDGALRAVSSRAYQRHATCRAAFERFRLLLGELDAHESQETHAVTADPLVR
ncbi:hypothetical protein [Streptomyces sp. NPDC093225]|uniref:hypothetical protein n=1 Tax=Streptomyces sp. NPDC093225 TaxID=3366034 RepID=UPI00381C9772